MAEFCHRCSIELFGEDFRELAGIADEGYVVAVICEDCGIIWADHEGKCRTKCNKNHYETEALEDEKVNSTRKN